MRSRKGIFISYRRSDTAGYAGRLYDGLTERVGHERVFMDVDAIDAGVDFVDAIDRALHASSAFIALIGPNWLTVSDSSGNRRLDDPDDFVRREVGRALESDVLVLPVLVGGASMPAPDELPPDLADLARRNAIELSDERWSYDFGRLLAAIDGDRTRRRALIIGGVVALLVMAAVVATVAFDSDGDTARSGGRIAFLSDLSGNCEVHIIGADGDGAEQLTQSGSHNYRPDWSPDGNQLVYASVRGGDTALYVFDVEDGEEELLFDHPGVERGPDWSPDGDRIAFSSAVDGRSEIYVVDASGGADPEALTEGMSRAVAPDWSPDGGSLAFASDVDDDFDIYTMAASGGDATNVTGAVFGATGSAEFDPQWSPDGSTLVFDAQRGGGDFDIWALAAEGGPPMNLTAHSGNDRHATWAPDGEMLAFGSDRRVPPGDEQPGCATDEGQRDLFVMNADGSGQERLTRIEADDSDPSWQPEG